MDIDITRKNRRCNITLTGELTIYAAAHAKENLLSAIADCKEVVVDLGKVSEIDTAGLQLLALIKREAAQKNISMHFVSHSKPVLEVLDMCDLAAVFGDPVVIAA